MDPDWATLNGGYRVPYDPRPSIEKLRNGPDNQEAWSELWNELHHQGDVGEASYAAVPLLVEACTDGPRDWNFYGLVATIEVERHRVANPPLPQTIADDYSKALRSIKSLALEDLAGEMDQESLCSAMAVVALSSGKRELGSLLAHLDSNEIGDLLEDRLAWAELYRPSSR